ncbi:MAG: sigma-70 family RNA polymerase sigma factor [Bacillota bacterium]|nr:sigma-70 family RNA polymerase sigma factor [Bacillota bacterium]
MYNLNNGSCGGVLLKKEQHKTADNEMILSAQAGDRAAFDTILNIYKPLTASIAKKYYISGADSDDIMQEAMIGLFKAIRDYQPEKSQSFSAFAALCITRQIKTAVKLSLRKKNIPLNNYISFDAEDHAAHRSYTFDPVEKAMNEQTIGDFKEFVLKNLSEYEKQVLELYLRKCPYSVIAARLGTNAKSVDNAISRIKNKLKTGLTKPD